MLDASAPIPPPSPRTPPPSSPPSRGSARFVVARVDWFNGGLFDDDSALSFERAAILGPILDWGPEWLLPRSSAASSSAASTRPSAASSAPTLRPRQDHEDRKSSHRRPLLGEWAGARSVEEAVAREKAASSPAAATRHRNQALELRTFLERLKSLPRLRPRLRLRKLPLPRPARPQGHRAPRQRRMRSPRPPPHLPPGRPRGRPRHRAQPLRRRARPRLGLDRRDPVDARQRLRRSRNPYPPPPRHHRMPRCHPQPRRHPRGVAAGRRGGGEPAVSGGKAPSARAGANISPRYATPAGC